MAVWAVFTWRKLKNRLGPLLCSMTPVLPKTRTHRTQTQGPPALRWFHQGGWRPQGWQRCFFFIPYMAFLIQHVSWFLLGSLSITILRNFSCDKFYRKVFDGLKVKMRTRRRSKPLATRVRGVRALSLFQEEMRGWGRRQRCGSIFLWLIDIHTLLFACAHITVFNEVWFFRYGASTTSWWERERWRDACPLGPCHLYQGWSSNHLILVAKEVETQILT